MVLTGDTYPAEQLHSWGIVDRIVAADALLAEARSLARRFAAGPTLALAAGKTLLRTAATRGVAAADAITPATVGALFGTFDAAAGMRAVRESRRDTVIFEGR
jgi:enoyl-CoA hydratase/carnithine racemase